MGVAMKMWLGVLLVLAGPVCALDAKDIRVIRADLRQGGYWLAQIPPSTTVTVAGKPLPVVAGHVLLGFDRFAAPRAWVKVCHIDTDGCTVVPVQLASRTYVTQNVKGIAKKHVAPDPKQLARMAEDNAATAAARRAAVANVSRGDRDGGYGFKATFRAPVQGPTTGVYGSRRAYNGQERSWHKGLDFAAPTGTRVVAPAAGVVRLARDTFMSGNLIMLDHGAGLTTVYAHLSRMDVQVGQVVRAGDVIGAVGTTGRSSGPHLHWGMYWHDIAIDPQLWLGRTPPLGVAG